MRSIRARRIRSHVLRRNMGYDPHPLPTTLVAQQSDKGEGYIDKETLRARETVTIHLVLRYPSVRTTLCVTLGWHNPVSIQMCPLSCRLSRMWTHQEECHSCMSEFT